MQTPESEFHRVLRRETRHILGFPRKYMPRELVNKIDRQQVIGSIDPRPNRTSNTGKQSR